MNSTHGVLQRRDILPSTVLHGMVLLPLGALVYALSWSVRALDVSMTLAAVATLPLLAVVRWLWIARRQALLVIAPYLLFTSLTAASAVLIESGAYIPELNDWGVPNGTAARVLLETALLFWVIGLAAGAYRHDSEPSTKQTHIAVFAETTLLCATAAVLLLPAVNLLRLGIPLVTGIDRVAFYQQAGPLHLRFIVLAVAAVPPLSYLAVKTTSAMRRAVAVALVVALLGVMVLSGEKFYGLVITVYAAALPVMLMNRTAALKRILMAALVMLTVSAALIVYHYGFLYEVVDVGEFAMWRISAQAEVPWAVDMAIARGRSFNGDFVGGELLVNATRPQGMERLMLEIAPRSFIVPFIESGSRFPMGFPAILKMHFGAFGVLLAPVFAIIVGLIVRLLLNCFRSGSLFALWMGMNIFGYNALLDQILLHGNLYQLGYFEPTRFVWIVLLLIFLFLPSLTKVRRDSR